MFTGWRLYGTTGQIWNESEPDQGRGFSNSHRLGPEYLCVCGGGGAGGILRPVLELLQVWAGLRSKSESGDTR